MYTAKDHGTPFSIRYPRGEGVMPEWKTPLEKIEVGKGIRLIDGDDIAVLAIGHPVNFALRAQEMLMQEGISAAVYDLRFAKPIDAALLQEVCEKYDHIITVEDGCLMGGVGSAVLEFMADHGYRNAIQRLGIPDKFIEHGEQHELYSECHFDAAAIASTARKMVGVVLS
jgi:1-deoxy-D-xylulose-5-phosphate synthase